MSVIEYRQRQWFAMSASIPIQPVVTFEDDRLVLGVTVLAKLSADGLALNGEEARLLALLSAAYRRPIDLRILNKLKLAAREWRRGQAVLAKVHLALSGLHSLERPEEAAYRLFLVDGLIARGMKPSDIMRALDLDPIVVEGFEKVFNPGQARVPKGSGRPSGRWTASDDSEDQDNTASSPKLVLTAATTAITRAAPSFFGRGTAAEALAGLGEMATGLSAAAISFGLLFIPDPGHGSVSDGEVTGKQGLNYHWDREEGRLSLAWHLDGLDSSIPYVDARVGSEGIYRDQFHRPVAREVDGHLVFDMDALDGNARDGKSIPLGADATSDDRPKLCPDPGDDVPHGASEQAWAYQQYVTGLPKGLAIWFNGKSYDGCRETNGHLLEAKADYAQFVGSDGKFKGFWTGIEDLRNQMESQAKQAMGRIVEYHIKEKAAVSAFEHVREDLELSNVVIIYDPGP